MGRFLTRDSYTGEKDEPLSLHLYTYCEGDGVNHWDPSGNSISSFIRQKVQGWKRSYPGRKFYADTRSGRNMQFMRSFDFFPYYYHGNLTYRVGQNCWQRKFGYNDLYDYVFISATGSFRKKFVLNIRRGFFLKKEYILWAWKGDYLNLGAGAELGIYLKNGIFHSKANQRNAMFTGIEIKYQTNKICSRFTTQKEWWITGFVPSYQYRNPRGVSMCCYADFSRISRELWNAIVRNRNSYPMRQYWTINVRNKTGYFEW